MSPLMSVEAARAKMLACIRILQQESLPLDQARGRILAQDVIASRDQPPFPASAMDGYAVRSSDAPGVLKLVGESHAGAGYDGALNPGEAIRILTGAPVPEGADRVIIQEDVTQQGDAVLVPKPQGGDNIRPRGVDFKTGTLLAPKGSRVDAITIALSAAAGLAKVQVMKRPRVAILATGDELAAPGTSPKPHQIFDSGTPSLSALCETWGATATPVISAADEIDTIAANARKAMQFADILLVIGGASVGDRDLAKPALMTLDLELLVNKVSLRPGKPVWFGRNADCLVLGLPGNPASGLVCAYLFLLPMLRAMSGVAPSPAFQAAKLSAALPPNGPREHYIRASLNIDSQGQYWTMPFEAQDSSLLSVFSKAQCLIRRMPDAPQNSAGEVADVLLLERNFG